MCFREGMTGTLETKKEQAPQRSNNKLTSDSAPLDGFEANSAFGRISDTRVPLCVITGTRGKNENNQKLERSSCSSY